MNFPRVFLADATRRAATDEDFAAYLDRARQRVTRPSAGLTMAETLAGWAVHLMHRGGVEEALGRTADDAVWEEQRARWETMAEALAADMGRPSEQG
jgi:hypothetical protein